MAQSHPIPSALLRSDKEKANGLRGWLNKGALHNSLHYCSNVWGWLEFLKEVSYAHQGCIDLISKNNNIVKYYNL